MEDYIEMIYRKTDNNKEITIKHLSESLNVKPSSVSKMANKLKLLDFINFEKYGQITLTEKGVYLGRYLLYRHNILKKFFTKLNKERYKLEQVEKIEHFIDYETISIVILIIGLVISAIMLGITIANKDKNNRH